MPGRMRQGDVTFRGRGLAFVHGSPMAVKICPVCSRWNAPQAAERGRCGWCADVPFRQDVEAADDVPDADRGRDRRKGPAAG